MPFSSPSYFASVRNTDRIVGQNAGLGQTGNRVFLAGVNAGKFTRVDDVIVIGSNAFSAGTLAAPITDVDLGQSVFMGTDAAALLTSAPAVGGSVVIGYRAMPVLPSGGGNVVLGAQALEVANNITGFDCSRNVVIGTQAMQGVRTPGGQGMGDNVVIGYQALRGGPGINQFTPLTSVVIGAQACDSSGGGAGYSIASSVVVGYRAGRALGAGGASQGCVLVGHSAGDKISIGDDNVCIGKSAGTSIGSGNNNICIGTGADVNGAGSDNTIIGWQSTRTNSSGCIFLGSQAGNGTTAAQSDLCAIETFTGGTRRSALFVNMAQGNTYMLGVALANRDLDAIGATNAVKLANGSRGVGNPALGGFFYAFAGALHWVGSAGTDTVIAPA